MKTRPMVVIALVLTLAVSWLQLLLFKDLKKRVKQLEQPFYFASNLGNAWFYNRALSSNEVQTIYEHTSKWTNGGVEIIYRDTETAPMKKD